MSAQEGILLDTPIDFEAFQETTERWRFRRQAKHVQIEFINTDGGLRIRGVAVEAGDGPARSGVLA